MSSTVRGDTFFLELNTSILLAMQKGEIYVKNKEIYMLKIKSKGDGQT